MTDVQTGDAIYHLTGAGDLEQVLKASSAMPLLYRDYPKVGGRPMTDGGVADALPVGEAIRRGARRIMVIRSRPREYRKRTGPAEYVHALARATLPAAQAGDGEARFALQ